MAAVTTEDVSLRRFRRRPVDSAHSRRTALFKGKPPTRSPKPEWSYKLYQSIRYSGRTLQIGDVMGMVDSLDGLMYFGMVRAFLTDSSLEKSAFLSWLVPTRLPYIHVFHPDYFVAGPEETVPRKLSVLHFICRPGSDYHIKFNIPDVINCGPTALVWGRTRMAASHYRLLKETERLYKESCKQSVTEADANDHFSCEEDEMDTLSLPVNDPNYSVAAALEEKPAKPRNGINDDAKKKDPTGCELVEDEMSEVDTASGHCTPDSASADSEREESDASSLVSLKNTGTLNKKPVPRRKSAMHRSPSSDDSEDTLVGGINADRVFVDELEMLDRYSGAEEKMEETTAEPEQWTVLNNDSSSSFDSQKGPKTESEPLQWLLSDESTNSSAAAKYEMCKPSEGDSDQDLAVSQSDFDSGYPPGFTEYPPVGLCDDEFQSSAYFIPDWGEENESDLEELYGSDTDDEPNKDDHD